MVWQRRSGYDGRRLVETAAFQPRSDESGVRRNVICSAKTTPATIAMFYELARRNGWKAGETFEKAVDTLRRQGEEP
jgi:hypothetical protein